MFFMFHPDYRAGKFVNKFVFHEYLEHFGIKILKNIAFILLYTKSDDVPSDCSDGLFLDATFC